MGLFTTIENPETGLSVQIKTGGDSCDTYKLGEIINVLNGCYSGLGRAEPGGKIQEYWVVIKESKAVAIRPRSENPDDLCDEFGVKRRAL